MSSPHVSYRYTGRDHGQESQVPRSTPGLRTLIDVHTHMTIYTDETPGEPMLKQLAANPPAVEVFPARKGALRTLEAGVTTVRDLVADQYMDIAMREGRPRPQREEDMAWHPTAGICRNYGARVIPSPSPTLTGCVNV